MSVHAVKLVAAPNHSGPLKSAMETTIAARSRAMSDRDLPIDTRPADGPNGIPERVTGLYRFGSEEALAGLLNALENNIPSGTSWWGIYYHECNHDTGEDCGDWILRRSAGAIPSGVRP